jgi:hypothetical protein
VPPFLRTACLLLSLAACGAQGTGPVVTAPAAVASPPPRRVVTVKNPDTITACALPWTLEDVEGGAGRVVAVCGSDVRRMDLEPGAMMRAIEVALEPGRARVCACARQMTAPPSVDLVVTSAPDEGRASVEPGEPDDEQDAELAAPFAACIGTVKVSFPRFHADTCGPDRVTFKYPLHVELTK